MGTLVPLHLHAVRLSGAPGARTLLGLSTTWPAGAPASVNGIPVGVDLVNLVLVWDGLGGAPAPVIGAGGFVDVPFVVPDNVPIGSLVHVQALVQVAGGPALITPHLDLRFGGEPLAHLSQTSQSAHPLASSGGLLIVGDAPTWNATWALHAPGTTPPAVDFNTSFVVARWFGTYAHPNVWASIDDVFRDAAGTLQVYATQSFGGALPPPQTVQVHDFVSLSRAAYATAAQEHLQFNYYP
jgi:hypothetical protein